MRIILVFIVIFFAYPDLLAQRNLLDQNHVSLSEDFNIEEAALEDYFSQGKIETFNEEKHKTRLAKKLLNTKSGRTVVFKSDYYKTKYKIISKEDIKHFRVRYIFINKAKFDSKKAFENYTRKVRKLLNATSFKTVAKQYSMDFRKHVGGDSGWFKKSKAHPNFYSEVTSNSRLAEEIFEFEIPELNGYYFVQKHWSPRDIKEILVVYNRDKN